MTSAPTATRTYRVVGTTDDATGCDCCGRMNLKVYVVMTEIDGDGDLHYFGTGCAAIMEGVTNKEIKAEIDAADQARRDAEEAVRKAARDAENVRFYAWVTATFGIPCDGTTSLHGVGGMSHYKVRLAWREAGRP